MGFMYWSRQNSEVLGVVGSKPAKFGEARGLAAWNLYRRISACGGGRGGRALVPGLGCCGGFSGSLGRPTSVAAVVKAAAAPLRPAATVAVATAAAPSRPRSTAAVVTAAAPSCPAVAVATVVAVPAAVLQLLH